MRGLLGGATRQTQRTAGGDVLGFVGQVLSHERIAKAKLIDQDDRQTVLAQRQRSRRGSEDAGAS